MIVPDDKDWTWVLDRGCPDCGFDARTCAVEAVPELVRGNAVRWRQLLEDGATTRADLTPRFGHRWSTPATSAMCTTVLTIGSLSC
jgi:hypothetical protein